MLRTVAIVLCFLLSACGKDPFGLRDTPRTATELAYAKEVCEAAGRQSRACIDARHQMDLQCYRTLGTVDCYRTSDPFGNAASDRAVVVPLDRRTAPQPLVTSPPEEPKSDQAATEEVAGTEPEPDAQTEATPTE